MEKIIKPRNLTDVKMETDRLVMLPVSLEFVPEIFKEFTDEITTYMRPRTPQKIEETEAYIMRARQELVDGTDIGLSIFTRDTREFIGGAGIHHIRTPHPTFGIWIKKSAHGNTYGQEAVCGLLTWANQNLRFEYITYPVVAENTASRKIAELLGGRVEKEYNEVMGNGRTFRVVEYRIPNLKRDPSQPLR